MNTENTAASRINEHPEFDRFSVLQSLCEATEPTSSQQDTNILESISQQYGSTLESLSFAQKVDLLEWCTMLFDVIGEPIPTSLENEIAELSNDGLLRLMEATIAQLRSEKGGAIG